MAGNRGRSLLIDSVMFSEIRSKARSQLRVGLGWNLEKKEVRNGLRG